MKEQLQFAARVLNARLQRSDPHIGAAWPGRGLRQGSRPLRGAQSAALTQALPPARFSAMWGMCKCGPTRDLKAQDRDRGHRGHGRRRHGESFPVPLCEFERKTAALRSAAQLVGSPRSPSQRRGLSPHCVRIAVFLPVRSRTASSWIHRRIHEVAPGRW